MLRAFVKYFFSTQVGSPVIFAAGDMSDFAVGHCIINCECRVQAYSDVEFALTTKSQLLHRY